MTGAILVTMLAVLCAVAIFATVLATRRPPEGWRTWLRESLAAWRREDLEWTDDVDEEDAGGLGTLYLMSEPGNAYATPEEIAGPLVDRLRDLETHVVERRRRGEGQPTEAHA